MRRTPFLLLSFACACLGSALPSVASARPPIRLTRPGFAQPGFKRVDQPPLAERAFQNVLGLGSRSLHGTVRTTVHVDQQLYSSARGNQSAQWSHPAEKWHNTSVSISIKGRSGDAINAEVFGAPITLRCSGGGIGGVCFTGSGTNSQGDKVSLSVSSAECSNPRVAVTKTSQTSRTTTSQVRNPWARPGINGDTKSYPVTSTWNETHISQYDLSGWQRNGMGYVWPNGSGYVR